MSPSHWNDRDGKAADLSGADSAGLLPELLPGNSNNKTLPAGRGHFAIFPPAAFFGVTRLSSKEGYGIVILDFYKELFCQPDKGGSIT